MAWQRARNPNQKAERMTAILASAAGLFDQQELSEISMRDIAECADLSKASLYSYFKTKEEVFAVLFLQECRSWLNGVETKLARLRSPNAQRVAKILTDVIKDELRFCRLTVVLASVLERNLSKEFIQDFKTELNSGLADVVTALQRVFPDMTDQAGTAFVYQHQAMIAGLWPITHPVPLVAEVLAQDEYKTMQVDFYAIFQASVEKLLQT